MFDGEKWEYLFPMAILSEKEKNPDFRLRSLGLAWKASMFHQRN